MIATRGAPVLERHEPMAGGVELVCESALAASVQPGAFFQIAVGGDGALLRRPYSAAWVDADRGLIGFLFNVVGVGSGWLASRGAGMELDLLGPLGRGFDLDGERPAVCVAGGLGIAVFLGVTRALAARGRRVLVMYGARTADMLVPLDRFPQVVVRLATDDGSAGHPGRVTELLRDTSVDDADLFACGPTPMLLELTHWARGTGFPLERIQVAHETAMGCGIGTCLGCAVPRAGGGYLLTCQAGPCISADQVEWSRMEDAFHG